VVAYSHIAPAPAFHSRTAGKSAGKQADGSRGPRLVVRLSDVSAFYVALWVAGVMTVVVWLLGLVTGDHSWVDRIWSIIPVAYVWIFAGEAGLGDARLDVIAILVTMWGARLTFNFARKGGYRKGGEDYRWAVVRSRMKPWQFQIFALLFIAAYQNALLLLISLPALTAEQHRGAFGVPDVIAAFLFVLLLAGETVADQQQWRFQLRKKAEAAAGSAGGAGFLRTGLFRYSRHPNYFCEIAIWWVVFAFGAISAHSVAQWTVAGAVLLTLLFAGSTVLTENISASKYPDYAAYQRATPAVVPWFPRSVGTRRATTV
jgi:steroid 5-alpha reductase family enzyme